MVFCSITKARVAAKLSSRAKSRAPLPRSSTGCKKDCSSAISMQNETGATRQSMSKECGEILQLGEGDDFVLATGETRSVREFAETAFSHVDLDWKEFVKHDAPYQRPAEVDLLIGDASKAKKILGWEPKVRFHELVRIMVDADMELLSRKTQQEHLVKLP